MHWNKPGLSKARDPVTGWSLLTVLLAYFSLQALRLENKTCLILYISCPHSQVATRIRSQGFWGKVARRFYVLQFLLNFNICVFYFFRVADQVRFLRHGCKSCTIADLRFNYYWFRVALKWKKKNSWEALIVPFDMSKIIKLKCFRTVITALCKVHK